MTDLSNAQWGEEPSDPEISVGALASAQHDEDGERSVVGERFGKYLIVGEVAVGGMAEVFLGVQRGLEGFVKVCVIKRVLPHLSSDPEFVRMFIDEARLAARLEHPNIVRTHEFGEVDGQYFTAMEYLAGEDLSKVLNTLVISNQTMPFNIAAGVIQQLCAGLHFAHQLTDTTGRALGLVHRDVNPANIIITYGGEVKIIDFGVAKTNSNAKTIAGTIKGKIAYMSPEQLLARGIDQRSDVFSTGVVLWEVLTGRPLFMRDNEAATLYAIMNDPIPPASRYRKDIPAELDAIVGRALSRTPSDRYESAEEMGDALGAFLTTQPKCDARVLGRKLEELFGSTRAEAKRSIAQTRSLGRNISLVMKLRSEVRADLAEQLDSMVDHEAAVRAEEVERPGPSRMLMWLSAAILLAGIAGGVLYVMFGSDLVSGSDPSASTRAVAQASLLIESTPPGAAISVGGEPTGLKTPATLKGIAAKQVLVRLELPGHGTMSESIDVPEGGTISKHFTLTQAAPGRLVISELPKGAIVLVDGEEHDAGSVIDVLSGTHDVSVVVNGRTITQQVIETGVGDQRWNLDGNKLVSSEPGT